MSNSQKDLTILSAEQKRALLAKLLQAKAEKSQSFPLSFAQQRLWFLNQLEPDSSAYNIPTAIRLVGTLNVPALEQTFNEIVRRHEVLRTTFRIEAGQPVQAIASTLTLVLPVVNLQHLPDIEREKEVQRLVNLEAQQSFNLTQAPLLRATLLLLTNIEHVVLFTMHHIVSDDWSIGILIQEVAALYTAFSLGKPTPLAKLSIQYADFAVWQRQFLVGETLNTQLNYWQQIASNLPVLQLPTDRPRSPVQTFQGATKSFSLDSDLTEALNALSYQEGVTLFMTLLAAFKLLLHRYTNQDDIVVGSPIANRNRAEIEGLIGFFINTLVLRTDLSGNPSFRELLQRLREVALGAYDHQDLPFEYLVEKLQPERNLSHNPLFQVTFTLQNTLSKDLKLPGLTLSLLEQKKQTAQFDLSLDMAETPSGLIGVLEYNTDIFDVDTITALVEHFCTLLKEIVANPGKSLSEFSLLTPAERQQLLVEWNDTQVDYSYQCIHQLFEAQVEQTPDAIAVVFADEQLTYRELNTRANQLAHHLHLLGVGPEVMVGLYFERSLEILLGILGILKAGGAYVPLDPSYPPERLAATVEAVKPIVLLTQQRLAGKLSGYGAKVVCLDRDLQLPTKESEENLDSGVTPENLAYVIFTSGSTGTPKGVMVTHHSLVNHSIAAAQTYQLQEGDRVLQFASISFDVAAEELFPSLLNGSTVVIRPDWLVALADFTQFLEQEKLTVLNLPTAYWHEWVSYLAEKEASLAALRLVIVGTEQALPEKLVLWQEIVGNLPIRWLNAYGVTEATIGVTIYESIPCQENPPVFYVPIGRPIANTQVYTLDKYLNPTPIGVPGELYISGVCLARGYLNQPELTAERFIPNPFEKVGGKGSRLYKTGDLARYLPSGDIELLGRIDHQVKIRGFRIELGEIEARLNQHPDVSQAVVVCWEDELASKRLVAYVTPQAQQTLSVTGLRNFLKEKLPQYMMPSAFVILQTLPLTSNGKVDRRSLALPETLRPELEVPYVMPQTELECTIANIWQKVLNIENVGIDDNFFELGGHSLLIAKVHSELREIFQTDLSILDLFRYPSIGSLVEYLSQLKNQTLTDNEINIQNEKIAVGKAQQKKRRQKMQEIKNS